jgi:GDPmannose 4,6-dehydratase
LRDPGGCAHCGRRASGGPAVRCDRAAYNEEASIAEVVCELRTFDADIEVIVVGARKLRERHYVLLWLGCGPILLSAVWRSGLHELTRALVVRSIVPLMARRALVTGIGGQDGSYLAEQLLEQGYEVLGTVLGSPNNYENLDAVRDRIRFVSMQLDDAESIRRALSEHEPDEVYHLASASFVPASWEDPAGTSTAAVGAISALLEWLRAERPGARFVNAASAEIFGAPKEVPQNEATPLAPLTPYGAAKAFGHFLTQAFRHQYGLHASSAILFNHESPRRPLQFLTRKVSHGAAAISFGLEQELRLGDLSARRDWGFAADYVRALRLMAAQDEPDDYIVATGEAHTAEEWVAAAFEEVGLEWRDHVRYDESLGRGASDSPALIGDPTKARERLGWEPEVGFRDLVRLLVESDLELLRSQAASAR